MWARACVVLIVLACVVCSEQPAEPGLPPARLVVPEGRMTFEVQQRRHAALPGSDGQLTIALGDITGGQVEVEVRLADGTRLLTAISMRQGGRETFRLDDRLYTLSLTGLVNQMLGADHAVFELRAGGAESGGMTEDQKIEGLLSALGDLEGATFLRNGDEHSAASAVEHLRGKWEWKADDIRSAEDFILVAATGSSMSGKAYRIRYADGRMVDTADFLRETLKQLDAEDS
jgi:hypothetical protein